MPPSRCPDADGEPNVPARSDAVARWLSSSVGTCRLCEQPVYPTDPRVRDPDEKDEDATAIMHLACFEAAELDAE